MNWFFIPKIVETFNAVRSNYDIISNILPSKKDTTEEQVRQLEFVRTSLLKSLRNQRIQYKLTERKLSFLFGLTTATIILYGIYAFDVNTISRNSAFVFFTFTMILLMFSTFTPTFHHNDQLKTDLKEESYFMTLYQEVINIERASKENDILLNEKARFLRWTVASFTLGVIATVISFVL